MKIIGEILDVLLVLLLLLLSQENQVLSRIITIIQIDFYLGVGSHTNKNLVLHDIPAIVIRQKDVNYVDDGGKLKQIPQILIYRTDSLSQANSSSV